MVSVIRARIISESRVKIVHLMTLIKPVELENLSKQWPQPSYVYTVHIVSTKYKGVLVAYWLSITEWWVNKCVNETLQSLWFVQVWIYSAVQMDKCATVQKGYNAQRQCKLWSACDQTCHLDGSWRSSMSLENVFKEYKANRVHRLISKHPKS